MDKQLTEISEDLQLIPSLMRELLKDFPADKKEALKAEIGRAADHLSKTADHKEDPFEGQSLQELLGISEETMRFFYHSAYNLHQKNEPLQARSLFRFLTYLNPNNVDYWMGLGLCFFVEGRISDARGAFEIARALDVTNAESYYFIAKCMMMNGFLDEALKVCDDAEQFARKSANAPCLQATLDLRVQIDTLKKRKTG